jgi:hypothetical protein
LFVRDANQDSLYPHLPRAAENSEKSNSSSALPLFRTEDYKTLASRYKYLIL